MAAQADDRVMISERLAPGMLPRVLNTTDMTIIFLAIVLFIVQASVIQPAGPAAYVYWVLGFLLFQAATMILRENARALYRLTS